MKTLLIAFASACFAMSIAAQDNPAPAKPAEPVPAAGKSDAKAHEGVWKPIAGVMAGAKLPDAMLKTITLKITGNDYEVTVSNEKEPDKGTCTYDTSTTPNRMTITGTSGPNKGKTFMAIYEMKDAGSLRVCYDLSGKEFPKEFKAPKGTQLYLVGYRRAKE